jgi:hypothetical protein
MMAFGTGSTWISISEIGEAKCSHNLGDSYWELSERYDISDLNSAEQIVLGSDGYYFIQYADKTRWNMPPGVSSHVNMVRDGRKINLCALGMSGSYVIQLSTGALFWDLKGHYAGLSNRIEKNEIEMKVESERHWLWVSSPPQVNTLATFHLQNLYSRRWR